MLQLFYDDFLSFVPLQLPQLLDVTKMEQPQFYDDYVLLSFPLADPYDLEEVMDIFEDDIELITLYHHIPSSATTFGSSTCAYSNPAFGQMFKMNARVSDTGKVDSIDVTIYESLEFMCSDICLDLKLHEKTGHFKYRKTKEELLADLYETDDIPANAYILSYVQELVVVDDGYGYRQSVVFRRGRPVSCVCRMLRLRSTYKHNGYERGTKWSISEYELDKALARYRQKNHELKAAA